MAEILHSPKDQDRDERGPAPEHNETVALLRELLHTGNKIMSALENLTAALTTLTTSVDNAVTVLGTPHPTDAQVQAAADAINSQAVRLDTASGVTPPTPPAA